MQDRMKLSDNLTVGAQPSEDQLKELAREGFRSVVNLRTEGEEEQPFSPQEEGEKVEGLGMQYLHIPVSSKAPDPKHVDEFRQGLPRLPGPVFVHCHKGKRAGAFSMIHVAVESGMSGDDTLKQAEEMGFECDSPALKDFVRGYIDQNRNG